jgi:hypothetical protein
MNDASTVVLYVEGGGEGMGAGGGAYVCKRRRSLPEGSEGGVEG